MRRIIAQSRKELTQIVRDWRTLALALVLPVVLLLLLSAGLSLTVNELPIAVQDFDGSSASNNFIDAFRASITFMSSPGRWINPPTKRSPQTPREPCSSSRRTLAATSPAA